MKFPRKTWLVLSLTFACGDDEGDQRAPCEQLQATLCSHTRECGEAAGVIPAARHDAFFQDCLRSDLQCSEPLIGGDLELCQASLATLPCDYVVEQLRDERLVSSSSCEEYIAL